MVLYLLRIHLNSRVVALFFRDHVEVDNLPLEVISIALKTTQVRSLCSYRKSQYRHLFIPDFQLSLLFCLVLTDSDLIFSIGSYQVYVYIISDVNVTGGKP